MTKRSAAPLVLIALLFLYAGCSSLAEKDAVSEESRNEIRTRVYAGWTSLWGDDFKAARAGFQEALDIDPENCEALRGLGLARFSLGDYFGAADCLLLAIEKDPSSPYAVVMRDFLQSEIPFSLSLQGRISESSAALTDKDLPLWVRREGYWGGIDYNDSVVPLPETVREYALKLGVIRNWSVLGPFSNVSGSGRDRAFIDETAGTAPDMEAEFAGAEGVPIRWRKPGRVSNSGEVFLSEYTSARNSTAYAETAVTIPETGSYALVFSQYGAIKAWVDGTLVLSDPEYRYGADVHWAVRDLEAGEHRVLVKVSAGNSWSGFCASLVDLAEEELPEEPSPAYRRLFPQNLDIWGRDPILEALSSLSEGGERRAEDLFWLSFMLRAKGYRYEALSVTEEGRGLLPNAESALFDLVDSRVYRSLGKEEETFRYLNRPMNRNVLFAPSAAFLIEEYIGQSRWSEAGDLIHRATVEFGPWFYGTALSAVREAAMNDEDGAAESIKHFNEAYPDSPYLVYQLLDNPDISTSSSAEDLFSALEKKGRPVEADLRRLRFRLASSEWGDALTVAKRLIVTRPEKENVWAGYLKALIYSGNLNPSDSTESFDTCLESFPLSSDILGIDMFRSEVLIDYINRPGSDTSSAEKAKKITAEEERLKRSLPVYLFLNPTNARLRERLQELRGKPPLGSLLGVCEISSVIAEFEARNNSYDTDTVVVLDEDEDVFFADGGTIHKRQDVIKVLSRQGVREASTFFLEFDPDYEDVMIRTARLVKPDGAETTAVRSGNRLSFPGLAPGDYIVVSYTCYSSRSGALKREIWAHVLLNDTRPVFMRKYTIVYPDTVQETVAFHNIDGETVAKTEGPVDAGMEKLTFTVRDREAVPLERWSAGWQDSFAWLDISSIHDWETIAAWYSDVYRGRCEVTPGIAETAASLIEGAENREEIIRRISSFVSGQIDYEDLSFQYSAHVPQTAESVLEDRYGDCKDQSVLLIALLSASGIDAHIALSYPGYAGDNTFLPSPRFTHAFVIVPGPDGDLILDPTPGSYTFPELPAEMSGSWYLPITPPAEGSAAELRRIGPAFDPDMTWIVYAIEAGTETSRIQASATYSGYHAGMVRALHATAEDPLSRLYFSLLLEREMPGFRLEEAAARHMDDLSLSPAIEFTGTFPGLLTSLGKEAAALSLPWSVTLSPSLLGIGRAEGGSAALRVSYPELATPKKQVMIVTLPPGYALRSLPENAVLRYKTARAIFRYSSRGGKLICERELCVPVMNIPREEADDFSAFVTGVFEKERELILIAPLAGLYGTEGRR